jgi:glycosyltransferase involved in cell wall biosynthesis
MLWNTLAALRVLLVLPFPVVAEGGAAVRCAIGLMRGLQAHGVEVLGLSADARPDRSAPPPADLPLEVLEFDYPSPMRHRLQRLHEPYGLLAGGPLTGGGSRFAARLRELAPRFDLVHVDGLQGGSLLPLIGDRPGLVQLDCVTRRDRDLKPPWTREGRIGIELLRGERRSCRRARWLLASSEEVARDLARAAPQAHVAVAPLPLDDRPYAQRAPLDEPVAGLIGLAQWPPTANAVRRLLTDVWPRVLAQRPGARLRLAGFGMEPEAFADVPTDLPGVEWLGRVPSATDFLRSLGVLLYPLDRGSGAKVKVLEALAVGLPVVTTPDGAEGTGGRGGIVVETGAEELASATVALLDDAGARRAAGDAARETFLAHHAPRPATAPLVRLYERMLA